MERKKATKSFSLPNLIVRVGAGSPIVSRDHFYYIPEIDPHPVGESPQELSMEDTNSLSKVVFPPSDRSIEDWTTSLDGRPLTDGTPSPSQVPLPPSISSLDGSPESEEGLPTTEDTASPSKIPLPLPESSGNAMSLSTKELESGENGETDEPDAAVRTVTVGIIARDYAPATEVSNQDTWRKELQAVVQRMEDDAGPMSPQLPRNPSVTPAEGLIFGMDDGTTGERAGSLGRGQGVLYKGEDITDYFAVPARVVVEPSTPFVDLEDQVTAAPVLNYEEVAAPVQLPESDPPKAHETLQTPDFHMEDPTPVPGPGPETSTLMSGIDSMESTVSGMKSSLDSTGTPLTSAAIAPDLRRTLTASKLQVVPEDSVIEDEVGPAGEGDIEDHLNHLDALSKEVTALPDSIPNPRDSAAPLLEDNIVHPVPFKGALLVRKLRSAVLRPIILKVMLGRQLAGPTKEALKLLAKGEECVAPYVATEIGAAGIEHGAELKANAESEVKDEGALQQLCTRTIGVGA